VAKFLLASNSQAQRLEALQFKLTMDGLGMIQLGLSESILSLFPQEANVLASLAPITYLYTF
jgi:hypothetical protein